MPPYRYINTNNNYFTMKLQFISIFISILVLTVFCRTPEKNGSDDSSDIVDVKTEKYRPIFHFTPAKNWINDPNGLVYYEDEYHLFYQYNPFGTTWGHMSWGHAVSKDLIKWEHLPVALMEEDGIMIFSGSAVVDKGNTSGLCTGDDCLVAIYTSHIEEGEKAQHQSIAYSNDNGRTWEKYSENPVLDLGMKDFRDPKVLWYGPEEKWVMVVSHPLQYKVQFYESYNLIDWELTGEFGGYGDVSKIWECPDLIKIKIKDTDEYRWVLIISSGSQYGDFTGMQYFIGDFDGKKFIVDEPSENPKWLDYGKDYYAAIAYNNLPEDQPPIMIGWINNWRYANAIPTSTWRGMMSIPRELTLERQKNEIILAQKPVRALMDYCQGFSKQEFSDQLIESQGQLLNSVQVGSSLLKIEFENIDAEEFGIEIFKSEGEKSIIGYSMAKNQLFINRMESGKVDFNDAFASIDYAPLSLVDNKLSLNIIVDQSIIEVFGNGGTVVITDQVFPDIDENKMQLYSKGGSARLINMSIVKIQ